MIYLVAGPPCSGKTTWAQATTPGRVLDYDYVYSEVTGQPLHSTFLTERHNRMVDEEFDRRMRALTDGCLIRGAPHKSHRAMLRRIHHAQSVVMLTDIPTCLERLAASDRPDEAKAAMEQGIYRWYQEYEPSTSDVVISTTQGMEPVVISATHLRHR